MGLVTNLSTIFIDKTPQRQNNKSRLLKSLYAMINSFDLAFLLYIMQCQFKLGIPR